MMLVRVVVNHLMQREVVRASDNFHSASQKMLCFKLLKTIFNGCASDVQGKKATSQDDHLNPQEGEI